MKRIVRSYSRGGDIATEPATLHVGVDGAMLTTGEPEEYLIADEVVTPLP